MTRTQDATHVLVATTDDMHPDPMSCHTSYLAEGWQPGIKNTQYAYDAVRETLHSGTHTMDPEHAFFILW